MSESTDGVAPGATADADGPPSDAVLRTTGLTKRFGALTANDSIDFSVERGELRGLIGPNGSGKTTFFNTVTGFLTPDAGEVRFDGEKITGWRPHRIATGGLARTFQITTPFESMTVRNNLLAVPTPPDVDARARADRILSFLEIDHLAGEEASDMSGGQQKLLELGRVLMLDPDCVLLDEPTAGVNPRLQDRILDHIHEMNDRGTTFVIIEHDLTMISETCDTITVFDRGSPIAEGTFAEIKETTDVQRAYLGEGGASGGVEEWAGDDTTDGDGGAGDAAVPRSGAPAGGTVSGDGTDAPDDGRRVVATDIVTGYGEHRVLHGVSVESREGVTCILGPNGSGKSTLLKAINGQCPPWSGTVRYGDRDVTDDTPLERVRAGLVTLPQEGGVFRTMTVEENLKIGAYNVLDDEDRIAANFETVLAEFPALEDRLDAKAEALSGGQQMMVSIGRAMMTDADVYLLDEPTAGLAPDLVADALELIETLTDRGHHVLLVEQNVQAALGIADYVYVLAQGERQFAGTPTDLVGEDELLDLYLGI